MSNRFLVNPNTVWSGPDGRMTREGFNQLKDLHDEIDRVRGDIPPDVDLSTILSDIEDLDQRVTALENAGGGGGGITWSGAIATTSGSSAEFTSIPAGAVELVIAFNGVSLTGADGILLQLGTSGGYVTTGYVAGMGLVGATGNAAVARSDGMVVGGGNGAVIVQGLMNLHRPGGNLWVAGMSAYLSYDSASATGGGRVTLGSEATRLRLVSAGGSDTFDAGSFYVGYR